MLVKIAESDWYKSILTAVAPLLLQLYFIRYVSHSVDAEVYGNFVLLQVFVTALSSILLQIPLNAYTRFYNESDDKLRYMNEFRSILLLVNVIGFSAIIIFSLYTSNKFDFSAIAILALYFILMTSYSLNKEVFLLQLRRKDYFYLQLLEAVAKFLVPVAFYYVYETLNSFIFGVFFGYLLATVHLRLKLRGYPLTLIFNVDNLNKYFQYGRPLIYVAAFSWGINLSDRYFIDYFLEVEDVAIYAILAQVAGFGYIFGQIYSMHVNPIIYRQHKKDRRNSLDLLALYTKRLALFFVVIFLIVLATPKEIFTIILTRDVVFDSYYYNVLLVLFASIFVAVLQNAYSMFFSLEKKLHIISYIYLAAFLLNLVGNLYIQQYGIMAAALSTLAAFLMINILQVYYIRRRIRCT